MIQRGCEAEVIYSLPTRKGLDSFHRGVIDVWCMKNAALYARVSSDKQEKERTIESQIAELKKQIAKSGNTLVKEYIDDGYSGFYLDRPAMNQLREDIKTNKLDSVYFLAADRIARELTYQRIIIGELIKYKKQIVIGGKNFVDNPENKLTLNVLGAVSEFERAKIIERSMRGRKHWLKQGVLMSNGCQTFGYTYHKRTPTSYASYTIDRKESPIVKEIFEMYAKGDIGLREIARHLKKKKAYRRPGSSPWNGMHIAHILNNEMYTGMRYFDTMTDANAEQDPLQKKKVKKMVMRDRRDWIGVPVPALISKELFNRVQTRLEHNRKCYRNAKGKQLLSGLLWCGKCGSRCYSFRQYFLIKRSRELKRIYEKYLYICSSRKNPGRCDAMQIDVRPLHALVFEMIEESLVDPEKLKANIKNANKRADKEKVEKKLKEMGKKIHESDVKKNRIVDLYASGDLAKEEYLKRIAQYDAEAASMKLKRDELLKRVPVAHKPGTVEAAIQEYCKNAREQYEQCNNTENKRQFLTNFIERVTYRNDRVAVEGSVPVDSSKVEFVIKRKIDRTELLEQVLQHDRKKGLRGSPVRRDYFGHLLTDAKVVTPKV